MKLIRLTFLIALMAGFISFSSCGPDNNPTPTVEEAQLIKLVKETGWQLEKVELSGVDKGVDPNSEYKKFILRVSGTFSKDQPIGPYSYSIDASSVYPAKSPWPTSKSGKWIFSESIPETEIIRDKGTAQEIIMNYGVTDGTLQLTFTYTRDGANGRTSSVGGQWVMSFKPVP